MDWLVLSLLVLACSGTPGMGANIDELHARLTKLHKTLDALMRQAMLQQLFLEEKTSGDGDSGVDQVGQIQKGTRPYHTESHFYQHSIPGPFNGMELKPNSLFTPGFDAVLNGIKFRTHPNYIRFMKPHGQSTALGSTEWIEKVKVPPAVLQKKTVAEQATEMTEWFKAFKYSNYKHRDFRPYFKPLLCYLEGYWERMNPSNANYFDEHFKREINRHRFETAMGRKQTFYTFGGFHPSKILDLLEDTPGFVKFKSRTLCAPLQRYVMPNRLRVIDELASRVPSFRTYINHIGYGNARFSINPLDTSRWTDRFWNYGFLDQLMAEIPGLDNYKGSLNDTAFDLPVYPQLKRSPTKTLNTAFYNRWFNVQRRGAMGLQRRHRGFYDSSIFMAQNSQLSIPAMSLEDCRVVNRKRVCKTYVQRWSYAVPLAVVYQTPLQAWNPYNVQEKKSEDRSVTANGRNGGFSPEKAFNGTSPNYCATLPPGFAFGRQYGVLDKTGKVIRATGCGIRQVMTLRGVGTVRQTYPIFPTHVEGNTENKELEALKDIVMESAKKMHLFR